MALNYYFKSKDIKVFPSSFRGAEDGKTFDPESRLNTEANFIVPKLMLGKSTYIFGKEDNIIKFVLGGYYFELDSTDYLDTLKGKTIGILLREVKLNEAAPNSYDSDRASKVLNSWETNSSKTLDIANTEPGAADATYYFTGLKILSETADIKSSDFSIMLFNEEGNLNQEALLVDLDHGTGEKTLLHGDGLKAGTINQTVFGTYNDNKTDTLFEVGKGSTNNTRANALEISTTTTTINNTTNINGDTIITGSTKIDGTTEITDTTEIKGTVNISKDTESTSSATGALKVAGGVGVSKNLNVDGDTNLNNKLIVKTSPAATETTVKVDGTLNVTNTTTIADNVTISTDKTTLAKPVEITNTTANALKVSGDATFNKNLSVGETTKVLEVKPTPSTDESNVTVTGTLKSTDKATFENGLEVASGKTTKLGGQVDITGAVNINKNNQSEPGAVTIYGNTTINSNLTVADGKNTTLGGDLTVAGKATSETTEDADEDRTLTTKGYVDRKFDRLDFTATSDETVAEASTGNYIQSVTQTDGKVTTTKYSFDTTFNPSSNNAPASSAVESRIDTKIGELNVTSVGTAGSYLQTIKEEDGKITATPLAFDTTISSDSPSNTNAPTSNAVKNYVESKILNPIEPIMALQCSSSECENKNSIVFSFTKAKAVQEESVTSSEVNWLTDGTSASGSFSFNNVPIKINKVHNDVKSDFYYWFSSSLTPLYTTTTENTNNSKTTTGNFAIGLWIRFTNKNGELKDWNLDDSALRINLSNLIKNRLDIQYSTTSATATVNSIASYNATQMEYNAYNYPSEDWAIFAEPIGEYNKDFIYITRSATDTRCRGFHLNIIVNAEISIGLPAQP